MCWEAENGWHNTIFNPHSLPGPVEVLGLEVLTADQCPVSGSKTVPS
jgi:hypothetical protein